MHAKKDQPLRLVWTERKIVSVRALSMYSVYIKSQIKTFIILDLLRRSLYRVCGAHIRVTGPRFEPQTSSSGDEGVISLDQLAVANYVFDTL